LKNRFSQLSSFQLTILSHSYWRLEVGGTQARAFKVGAEDLVSLTKENMIALDATSKVGVCQELVSVGGTFITANGDKVGFRQQIQGFLGGGDGGHGIGKLGE
jgi:hypothetical protein